MATINRTMGHVLRGAYGAFLLALLPSVGLAQTTPPPAESATVQQIQAVIAQVQNTLNGFINFGQNLVKTDLDLATAQANATGNTVAAKCWQTIEQVQLVPIPNGAGIAWFKQRYLDLAAQYVNVNQSCSTVAPAYVRLYNQVIQQMQALNL